MSSSSSQCSSASIHTSKVIILEVGGPSKSSSKGSSPRRALPASGSSTDVEPLAEDGRSRTRAYYRAHRIEVNDPFIPERRKLSGITNIGASTEDSSRVEPDTAKRRVKGLPTRRRQKSGRSAATGPLASTSELSTTPDASRNQGPIVIRVRRSERLNSSSSGSSPPAAPADVEAVTTPPVPSSARFESQSEKDSLAGLPRWVQERERAKAIFPEYPSNPQPWPALHPAYIREIEMREAHRANMLMVREAEKLKVQRARETVWSPIAEVENINVEHSSLPLRHRKVLAKMGSKECPTASSRNCHWIPSTL